MSGLISLGTICLFPLLIMIIVIIVAAFIISILESITGKVIGQWPKAIRASIAHWRPKTNSRI